MGRRYIEHCGDHEDWGGGVVQPYHQREPYDPAGKGSNSVITANVKHNGGTAVGGVTVTFTISAGLINGGAGPVTATTDASGNAVNTFTGGGAHPAGETNVVTATITVGPTSYTGNVIITYP